MKETKKSKIIRVTVIFFGLIFIGTVVSRITSSILTPQVEAEYVTAGTIEHNISADVSVSGDTRVPIYICAGIMVEEIYVSEGETVEKDDKLLRVNIDKLQELYLSKKIERKDMKLQNWYSSDEQRKVDELRLAEADEEIADLETLVSQDGIVYASFGGMVSEIRQDVGRTSTDDAALIITREEEEYTLKISITEAQKQYVTIGDTATVQIGKISVKSEVSALYEELANPQHYIVEVLISGDSFNIGDSVLVNIKHSSAKHDFVVPISAVRSDETSSYVFVVREKETMLGTELVATKVQVKVRDSNAEYAGISGETFSSNEKVIISSNKQIEAGDIVREK